MAAATQRTIVFVDIRCALIAGFFLVGGFAC
jgi:hypothetical protein